MRINKKDLIKCKEDLDGIGERERERVEYDREAGLAFSARDYSRRQVWVTGNRRPS